MVMAGTFRYLSSNDVKHIPLLKDQEFQLKWLAGFLTARIDNKKHLAGGLSSPSSSFSKLRAQFGMTSPQYLAVLPAL
jgi:hypothetical protein